jgi:hypothetical protein
MVQATNVVALSKPPDSIVKLRGKDRFLDQPRFLVKNNIRLDAVSMFSLLHEVGQPSTEASKISVTTNSQHAILPEANAEAFRPLIEAQDPKNSHQCF